MSAEDAPYMLSESRGRHPFPEMSAVGYVIGILLLPVLLPLVPFLLAYLAYDAARSRLTGQAQ